MRGVRNREAAPALIFLGTLGDLLGLRVHLKCARVTRLKVLPKVDVLLGIPGAKVVADRKRTVKCDLLREFLRPES